ncbi:hypothetical protein [Klebsiella quasipneumoniae]|uniref:hypothetical protein n=1 Tax=Klebsiella quasipneumoniae TaxID=1463165 RepID=UPI002B05FCC2|nr:hypothetical protein [Klebsiella quasipneumoniae]
MMIVKNKIIIYIFFVITLLAVSGCATTSYDAQADQLLTKYAQNSNAYFYKLEREFTNTGEVPVYKQEFYDSLHSDLAVIELRMTAMQQGEKAGQYLSKQFEHFYVLINDIEATHKKAYFNAQKKLKDHSLVVNSKDFTPLNFYTARKNINSYLTTLITYEATLKNSQISGDSK